MVKGVSRQVIVLHSPDPELFEQAIFILKDNKKEVTDEVLMKEAKRLLRSGSDKKQKFQWVYGTAWACAGALIVGGMWILSLLF